MKINYHSSVVFCNDLALQREFYENFLKQKVKQDLGACIVFENGFTLWKLNKDFPISKELGYCYEPIGNRNLELCFETDAFEEAVEEVLMSDLRILHNVEEERWGQYTIRIYDPEGNLLEIGETMSCMANRMKDSGMSINEIVEKTDLDIKYIDSLISA